MLCDLAEQHPSVGDVRSIGLFGVIELVKNRQTRQPLTPFNDNSPEMLSLRRFALDQGLYFYTHWHTILVIPPLIITEDQLADGCAILDEALQIADRVVPS
jgi:taurine--2-oxoglutarate transaminase